MDDLTAIHDFVNDTWRLIKSTINTHTDEEWMNVINATTALYNNPKYESLKGMSQDWLTGYIAWLEKRNTNGQTQI